MDSFPSHLRPPGESNTSEDRMSKKQSLHTKAILVAMLAYWGLNAAPLLQAQTISVMSGTTPASLAPGAPSSSYPLSNFENYSPFTGKVNVAVPLHSVGGRGAAHFEMYVRIADDWNVLKTPTGDSSSPFVSNPQNGNSWALWLPGYGPGTVFGREAVETINTCPDGRLSAQYSLSRLTFTRGDGSEIELRDAATDGSPYRVPNYCTTGSSSWDAGRGTTFVSRDGSNVVFVSDQTILDYLPWPSGSDVFKVSGNLTFPDGTTYRIDNSNVSWIRDRNGNRITLTYNTSNQVVSIQDQNGRTITVNYGVGSCNPPGGAGQSYGCDQIVYPGYQGASRTIEIGRGSLDGNLRSGFSPEPLTSLFPEISSSHNNVTSNFDTSVTPYIRYPDASYFTFSYSNYGEVARVVLPTGGAIEYDYGGFGTAGADGFLGSGTDGGPAAIVRMMYQRREYSDGGTLSGVKAYSYATAASTNFGRPGQTTTETDSDADGHILGHVTHAFLGNYGDTLAYSGIAYNDWREGKEVSTQSDFPTLKTVAHNWQSGGTVAWCNNNTGAPYTCNQATGTGTPDSNPQLASEVTTLNDTNQVSQVVLGYDQYNNVNDKKEYDWGNGAPGALLRETKTTYLWASNSAYASPSVNLLSAPYITIVDDGNGKQVSETWWKYDETTPQNEPGIVGLDGNYGGGFNLRGNVTSENQWFNSSNSFLTTTFTYDVAGNVLSKQDPIPNRPPTTYGYGDAQNTYAHVTLTTNSLGQATTAAYDYSSGLTIQATDLNKVATNYEYNDPLDRLTLVRRAAGTSMENETGYGYPNPQQVDVRQDQNATGDGRIRTTTIYDGLGRVADSVQYEDSSQIEVHTTYDALGRVHSVSNPARSGDASLSTMYIYTLGSPWQVQMPDGNLTTTNYSGNQTTITDAAGKQRRMTYDALGRLTNVVEDPSGLNYSTSYGYDALDDLTSVNQGAETRTFTYDSLKRLTSATNPESGTVNYSSYDGVGNLLTKTDARGSTVNYTYDAVNRMLTKSYANNAQNVVWTPPVSYTYDQSGVTNSIGHLTQVLASGRSQTNYGPFDPLGNVRNSSQSTANTLYSFAYTYNLADALTSETYPSGRKVSPDYDSANRVKSVTGTWNGSATPYVSGITYAAHGAPSGFSYYNGVSRALLYNNRLQVQENKDTISSQPNVAFQLQYYWGDNGNQITNNNGNLRGELIQNSGIGPYNSWEQFTYDGVNRLQTMRDNGDQGAQSDNERDFAYDQFGNMWVTNNKGFNAPGAMPTANLYNGANRFNNTNYDASGNPLSINGDAVAYDAEGRMAQLTASASLGGATMTYIYDGEGHRVEKMVNGAAQTVYAYDAQGQLVAEYAASATAAAQCQTCYLSTDHLGSIRMVTDQGGNVVARHDYLPFGDEIIGTAGRSSLWGASDNVDQKFTGKERDQESGLDFFGARYYGSALGRFMSPDEPFADQEPTDPQSWNLYSYVRSNPLSDVDPTGNACVYSGSGDANDSSNYSDDNSGGQNCSSVFAPQNNSQSSATVNAQQGSLAADVATNAFLSLSNAAGSYFSFIAPHSQLLSETPTGTGIGANVGAGIGLAVMFIGPGGEETVARNLLGTTRSRLLQTAQNRKLRNLINYLFRPGAQIGSGSTADAIRYELSTGKLLSPRGHFVKGQEARTSLQRLYRDPNLSPGDKQIVKKLLIDLQDALSNK